MAAVVLALVAAILSSTSTTTTVHACVNITAGLTVGNVNHYIFAGSEYTHYDMMSMHLGGGGQTSPGKASVSDFSGLDPNTVINAGVLDPANNDKMRLFSGNDVYLVDITSKKVEEKSTVSALFSADDVAKLGEKGVQAAASFGNHVYLFSGCHVIKTDFLQQEGDGSSEHFTLPSGVPCDVDAAFPFPQKDGGNLLIVKGAEGYGMSLTGRTGYKHMRCLQNILQGIQFNLCSC